MNIDICMDLLGQTCRCLPFIMYTPHDSDTSRQTKHEVLVDLLFHLALGSRHTPLSSYSRLLLAHVAILHFVCTMHKRIYTVIYADEQTFALKSWNFWALWFGIKEVARTRELLSWASRQYWKHAAFHRYGTYMQTVAHGLSWCVFLL